MKCNKNKEINNTKWLYLVIKTEKPCDTYTFTKTFILGYLDIEPFIYSALNNILWYTIGTQLY